MGIRVAAAVATAAGRTGLSRRIGALAAAAWLAVVCASVTTPAAAQEETLVEFGSSIRYLANASDPGIGMSWIEPGFLDGAWDEGTYGIGYDTAGDAVALLDTTVPAGTLSIFTRTTFTVAEVRAIQDLWIGSDHDDGIVVWINGTEVYRSAEMPSTGPLDWDTQPAQGESSNDVSPVYAPYHDISAAGIGALKEGENLLAVGVWNIWAHSDDLVLVPRLVANKGIQLTRGPYLQLGTPTSVRVRWRTDVYENSVVLYGPTPQDLSSYVFDPVLLLEHEIELTDLQPETCYYYAIGNAGEILAGADPDHYFETFPEPGPPRPTRIWFLGDSGFPGPRQEAVRDSYYAYAGDSHTDLWLHIGDLSQHVGTDVQFQEEFFDPFREMTRKTVIWPALGNHDAVHSDSNNQIGPYYENFSLPSGGEAGGLPSGTEAYYSFDFANMHFAVLNSQDIDRSPGGEMLTWLAADLASTDKDWIVAYYHHPVYSKGHHDSDDPLDSDGRMTEMRENALPVLEDYGVDLVLAGHSHCYERSFLLDGHYGTSDTLVQSMILDGGDGREDGAGAYRKPLRGPVPYPGPGDGAVFLTVGSGSSAWGGPLDHPVMVSSWNQAGSLVVDVDGQRLDAKFLIDTCTGPPCPASILDYFTIVKGADCQGSDADGDGVCDDEDNCPDDYNAGQSNADGDEWGDACDPCPGDPDNDADSDGVCGDIDNCPDDPNPGQEDSDQDGVGEACDDCPNDPFNDADADGHCADSDNCPDDANPGQEDWDEDGIGDVCDACPTDAANDADGDSVCGDVDNCRNVPNGDQADTDGDGWGNVCDPCALDFDNDLDGDLFCADIDNCPAVPNDQSDADADGVGDVCDRCPWDLDNDFDDDGFCGNDDNCPGAHNPDQTDSDSDGIGDACDFPDDADGDSVPDLIDNCLAVSNPAQQDADADAWGDACDEDDDGDGVADPLDCAPRSRGVGSLPGSIGPTLVLEKDAGTRLRWQRATQGPLSHVYMAQQGPGRSYPDAFTCLDFANPGTETLHTETPLPGEAFFYVVGAANTCGPGPLDNGREAINTCPLDGNDSDGDGVPDAEDNCPLSFDPDLSDLDGDWIGDVCDADDDNDGIEDGSDAAPFDPHLCGDADGDGYDDCSPGIGILLDARFDTGEEDFVYIDDPFRGTSKPNYADGSWKSGGGFSGGGLRVFLGDVDDWVILRMSGGWRLDFDLAAPTQLSLSCLYNMTQSTGYESDEFSEVLVSMDGMLVGNEPHDYVDRLAGDGNDGPDLTTGWRSFQLDLGTFQAGTHKLVLGGYNNKKTQANEWTEILFDNILVTRPIAQ